MSTPPANPFAGLKLTARTPPQPGPDQRLFSRVPPPPPLATDPPSSLTQEVGKEGSRQGTREVGKESSRQPNAKRPLFDLAAKPYRKDSFLFTDEEFEALEDLKLEIRRQLQLRTTKNDIMRSALHSVIDDYRRRGAESAIARQLQRRG